MLGRILLLLIGLHLACTSGTGEPSPGTVDPTAGCGCVIRLVAGWYCRRALYASDGTEFPLAFALTCQELGVRVRYIRPRRPQQNGKVERSHRIDDEEFWNRYAGRDFDAAMSDLAAWEYRYNHQRFSMALNGRTPMEKLAAMLAPPVVTSSSAISLQ